MSLNPLNELKRRLEDNTIPLAKRFCLAKNVIQTQHFPTAPKERVICEWLDQYTRNDEMSIEGIRDVLSWTSLVKDLTTELLRKIIEVIAYYIENYSLEENDLNAILLFIENENVCQHFDQHITEFMIISKKLLQHFKKDDTNNMVIIQKCQRVLNNYNKQYKESKRKLEFIIKFIEGDNLEAVFECLDCVELRNSTLNICHNILFPPTKRLFFSIYLQTLIRKESVDELLQEKGDNIQSVLKIMSVFFTFPTGRTRKEANFLQKYIDTFVYCFKSESQLIFAFYVMIVSSLSMQQSYLSPTMKMPAIIFDDNDEKIKRGMFLKMLQTLHDFEIDISVRFTDTLGEKPSMVTHSANKKNFTLFLQAAMLGQLKLEGKPDKVTLQIVTTALKLDPGLVESKINQILPPLMVSKKNNANVAEAYVEMLNCLLDIVFKLNRGTVFINQMLPHLKLLLEAYNTEQFELRNTFNLKTRDGVDCEKILSKLILGKDLFPQACVERYGRLTSELMFRQNGEILLSFQRDFQEQCLMMFEEGFVSPSVITIAEIIVAILCSFFDNCKMADHTVPQHISEEFWSLFQTFEDEVLKKFGECLLKLNSNTQITLAFLKLCHSYGQLKILNVQYSNVKIDYSSGNTSDVSDLSALLPFLSVGQWGDIAKRSQDDKCTLILDNILLLKVIYLQINKTEKSQAEIQTTKDYLINQIITDIHILESKPYLPSVLFTNLNAHQIKVLAKGVVKELLMCPTKSFLEHEGVRNNRPVLEGFMLELLKQPLSLLKTPDKYPSLNEAMTNDDFDVSEFMKQIDNPREYFEELSTNIDLDEHDLYMTTNCVELLKEIQVSNLEEKYQLTAIFVLLALKRAVETKKLKKRIDALLQNIFELSSKCPDIYKIFPVKFIFSLTDNTLLDLLKIKTTHRYAIVKSILETAVKKVKTDSKIIKKIVKIILSNQKNIERLNIEYFSNNVFQLTCIALPLIAKEKKAITTSAYRSILAELQEELHKSLLKSFQSIDFSDEAGNTDNNVITENNIATLNAMEAYSLTLSKYCETTDVQEIKNLECLWSGLGYFVQNAILAIKSPECKFQHVESSVRLLNVVLRNVRKLETHDVFCERNKLFLNIWQSLKGRLLIIFNKERNANDFTVGSVSEPYLDDIGVAMKFLCELSSVECFATNYIGDLSNMTVLKKPLTVVEEAEKYNTLRTHRVANYMWSSCLKANVVGAKCVAMSKSTYRTCKNLTIWLRQRCDDHRDNADKKIMNLDGEMHGDNNVIIMDDVVCQIIRIDLATISEVVLAAKRISLHYQFLDAIFEVQHMVHWMLGGSAAHASCVVSWDSFFALHHASVSILNSLLLSREEILEDRWPCYLQCYRSLVSCMCDRSTSQNQLDRDAEEKLGEIAHSMEKLTQSICKRKSQVSRLAAYVVADICNSLERTSPPRQVRQHLENSVALLIQISDSNYAVAFLRRALAGTPGHMTMTNLYTMYKRYHKYVGNA